MSVDQCFFSFTLSDMNSLRILLLSVICLTPCIVNAQWQKTAGPWSDDISIFATSGDTMLVQTTVGLYISKNAGTTWENVPEQSTSTFETLNIDGPFTEVVPNSSPWGISLNFDSTRWYRPARAGDQINASAYNVREHNGKFYLATDAWVFRSDDTISSWRRLDSGLGPVGENDFAFDDPYVIALTGRGIYISTNEGAVWAKPSTFAGWKMRIQSSGWLAIADSAVYRSVDHGQTWIKQFKLRTQALDITSRGDSVLVASSDGLYSSGDGGLTWNEYKFIPSVAQTKITKLGALRGYWVCQVGQSLYRFNLNAGEWLPITFTDLALWRVAANKGKLFAISAGMFVSPDKGDSWKYLYPDILETLIGFDSTRCFAADRNYFLISSDEGISWMKKRFVYSLTLEKVMPLGSTLLVFGRGGSKYTGTIYRSTNNGDTWTWVNVPAANDIALINGMPFIALDGGSIIRSLDSGNTWLDGPTPRIHIFGTGTLGQQFAIAQSGILRTFDSGLTWNALPTPADWTGKYLWMAANDKSLFVVVNHRDVFMSSDSGASWALETSFPWPVSGFDYSTSTFIATNDYLYACPSFNRATDTNRVWRFSLATENVSARSLAHQNDLHVDASYPNPAHGSIRLNLSSTKPEPIEIQLVNTLGQTVRSTFVRNTSSGSRVIEIERTDLPPGVYQVHVSNGASTTATKIILE
jgi:photosystem II stability/assembly factor-like uncharacterized protein